MKQVLDLHIHSSYSRACSPKLTLRNIEKTCRLKGIDIIGTGDFTHPLWFKSISSELSESFPGSGLYTIKNGDGYVKFIISTEVALIYRDEKRARRIHLVVHAPNIKAAKKLNTQLNKRFNLKSDGRPILAISAPDFVKLVLNIDPLFLIYPAHIWTPWFAVFGSKSGFDSLEGCFKDQLKNIYAVETGLSSDPQMNYQLSALDNYTLISSSDSHSLMNLGREATVMEFGEKPSYQQIYDIIKFNKVYKNGEKAKSSLLYTIEFYPEEGIYHLDGHSNCGFSCEPERSKILKNICPVCYKPLTVGVLNRVNELSDRASGFQPKIAVPFKKVIELDKVIAEALKLKNRQAKKVVAEYLNLVNKFGSELYILTELDLEIMRKEKVAPRLIKAIQKMRDGDVKIKPGFDGQYGQIKIL